ncbi:pyrimidine dimer DNA glycosylase/endonuclease V [Nesterenkonia sp. CL21]|uniref:pyrimidine dimer DNA glycosylase/endonuclease V n=1 Tax=Nesterenkonia sp. CL21 TaxID=3064894 RepID=UPI00287A28D0|nr:pyrimidine dimer DNA glycosylase/endonuclease V [Nesterenkonia sp. CL21]MDS2172288.1 pyrimidine dimer DNA glycosylase/endonuclease V [Nesterenkonia sp. CL21]
MRLWSLHPRLLDRQGLIACWREALLAQAVLLGRTRGYTRHPQLERFRSQEDPQAAIAAYLTGLHQEAGVRGYRFDVDRIDRPAAGSAERVTTPIPVTSGQLAFEADHLRAKLARRSPELLAEWAATCPDGDGSPWPVHPLFTEVPGGVEDWERP